MKEALFSVVVKKLVTITAFGLLFIYYACENQAKPEIHADIDNCVRCGMVISQVNQGAGFFHENEFVTFCSPTCLVRDYQEINEQQRPALVQVYFADFPTSAFVRADSTHFLLTGHISTVMNSGTLCFRNKSAAENNMRHQDEILADWELFQTLKGLPDKVVNIILSPDGMEPEIVVLNKNEIIEWIFKASEEKSTGEFYLKGYEEFGTIDIPSADEPVRFRMKASKPGSGFPVVRMDNDKIMGMVKISGAHTSDEEVM